MTIREIVISAGYVVDSQSAKNVEKSITSLKNFATKALGAIGIGFSLVKINALIEELTLIKQKVNSATAGMKDQAVAAEQVHKAADASRSSYKDMATTVTGLLNAHNRLFTSVQQTTDFAELMHKAFRASGLSAAETASLASSITSAFSTGKVSSGQFTSMMQKTPQVVTYLSKTLGITEQQVKALGTAGKITSTQLYQAFTQNADAINSSFGEVRLTITDALTSIKNQFGEWLTQLNDTYQITDKVARLMLNVFTRVKAFVERTIAAMDKLSKQLGGMENLLKAIGIGIVSVFTTIKGIGIFSAVAQGTTTIQKLATALSGAGAAAGGAAGSTMGLGTALKTVLSVAGKCVPWVLLIIAIITALIIAIEDIVNFFKGNDSVAGKYFAKLGVSAQELKDRITKIVGAIKSIIGDAMKVISNVIGLLAQVFSGVLADSINQVTATLGKLLPMLQEISNKTLPAIMKVVEIASKFIDEFMNELMEVGNIILDVLMSLLDAVWTAIEPVIDALNMILGLVGDLLEWLSPIIRLVMKLVQTILKPLAQILKSIFAVVGNIIGVVAKLTNKILGKVIDLIMAILNALTPLIEALLELVNDILEPLLEIVVSILEPVFEIINVLVELLDEILSPLIEILGVLIELLGNTLGPIIKLVVNLLKPLFEIIKAIFNVVSKVIGYVSGTVTGFVSKVGNAIKSLIHGPLEGIISVLKNIVGFISGVFSGDWSKAWKSLGNIPIAIINGIISGFESLLNFFVNAINAVTGALSSLWTWIGIPAIPKIPEVKFGRIAYLAKGGYFDKDNPTPAIVGDNKSEGEIVSPISMMRETFLDALATFASRNAGTAGAARALSQETTNKSIVQNVNIRNDFQCGSMEIGRTARDAMSDSTRDATAELAHALAYAR